MPVTMKDIARELGVSVVTVSKVIRKHADIGEETRQRVLKRVKELNYQPNPAARALVTGKTYTAGLIVPDLVHPFFAEVATGLANTLRRKSYSLLISSSQGDPELECQEIKRLLNRRLDALIIASTQWTVESFRRIEDQKVPYILIDRAFLECRRTSWGWTTLKSVALPRNISSRWAAGESRTYAARRSAPPLAGWKATIRCCRNTS